MDRQSPWLTLSHSHKVIDDFLRRASPVCEVHFVVINALFLEIVGVVGLVVETHDRRNFKFFEDRDVVLGSEEDILSEVRDTPESSFPLS